MTNLISMPPFAPKGSQRWLQIAVNRLPSLIDDPLRVAARLLPDAEIEWLSPLATECYLELSDDGVLTRLGVELKSRKLKDFWPMRGPRWDGLARTSSGDVFLVEAKAHIGEMVSGRCRASAAAHAQISESLREVQRAIAPGAEQVDWTGTFYQYANRLAHLHLLRMQNQLPAHLVYVYFLNAKDVRGPSDRAEYEGATKVIEHCLGIRRTRLSAFVHKLYVDVRDLEGVA